MNKEEIEKMKADLFNLHNMLGKKPSISKKAIKNALKYIEKLEQKEYILDKVTRECYRQKNFRNRIAREPDLFNQGQECFADKILNIIEGEKK